MKYPKRKCCTLVAAALTACCLPPALSAQEADAKTEQESAQPAESRNATPTQQMNAITVTATRQKQRILDIPATVSVITREEMDAHNVNDIKELIRYEPGIRVNRQSSGTTPFGGLGGFNIRGVGGNRVQMVVDGARVIEASDGGNRDFVDLSMMKAVEIQRGPASVLWGADALGGMVSYKTLDPDDLLRGETLGGKASYGFDGLNYQHHQNGMVAVQMDPTTQLLLGYTHRKYNEVRLRNARADGGQWGCTRVALGCDRFNPTDGESNNAMAKLVYRPNADNQFKLSGELFESDVRINQLYNRVVSDTATVQYGDYLRKQKQSRYRLTLEHEWDVNAPALDNITWRLSYSPQERKLKDRRFSTQNVASNWQDFLVSQNTDYSEDFYQADIQLTSSFNLGSSEHTLTYGFQGDITDTDYLRSTTTDNLTTGTSSGAVLSSSFAQSETIRADFYIQDEMKFFDARFRLIPGIRFAHYSMDPQPHASYNPVPGSEPVKITDNRFLPQLGMLFKMDEQLSFYMRYALGFKMPTPEQLYMTAAMGAINVIPNPDLKPEKVHAYEAGFRGEFAHGWFSFGGFFSDYTDFIKTRQRTASGDYTALNLDKVQLWGIEGSAEVQLAPNWRVNSSLTYTRGRQRGNNATEYVPFDGASPLSGVLGIKWTQPEHRLSTELVGAFSRRINRVSDDSYYKPAGYAVFDGYLNWEIQKNLRLTASVINIFNKRYFEHEASGVAAYATGDTIFTNPLELYTAPGRTFAATLTASF